jgi:hypothetical protein
MSYGVRVCFRLSGQGQLTSEQEFIESRAISDNLPLKLSAGVRGDRLGKSERFSVSSESFLSVDEAQTAGESIRQALLLLSVQNRRGIDLGQNDTRRFMLYPYGKQMLATNLGVQAVTEDHLGVTVYSLNPKPMFLQLNMNGIISRTAQSFMDNVATTVGRYRFTSTKAVTAAGLYALSHFTDRAPARFLLLFIALEALFRPASRSPMAQAHVDLLIALTTDSNLSEDEKSTICSGLSFQKNESIAKTGRDLAESLLPDLVYDSLSPGKFFAKIYKIRNNMVHRGEIDPESLHALVGEVDRFVADIVSRQAAVWTVRT